MEYNLSQLRKLAEDFAIKTQRQDVFALYGDLGSGKTTFAQYFINSLVRADVSSPTFNLVSLYDTSHFTIWHFDLYRVHHIEEVYELGIEESLNNGVTIIEWPQVAQNILPENTLNISFKNTDQDSIRSINYFAKYFHDS